jgi:hypothetical protein
MSNLFQNNGNVAVIEENSDDEHDVITFVPYFDYQFRNFFIDANGGESISFESMDDLIIKIRLYEQESNNRLYISKANLTVGYRQYKCLTHCKCTFKATFGRNGVGNNIILKGNYLYHSMR